MSVARVPSRYNIDVPLKHGRSLVYNSLSGAFALWEKHENEVYAKLRDGTPSAELDEKVLQDLHRGGYIVREGFSELDYLKNDYNTKRYDPGSVILTVAPTMACNFGCDYCFQGQDKPDDTMSADVQERLFAMVENNIPTMRHLSVAWYGGEPLMRHKLIKEMSDRFIDIARKRRIRYSSIIVTNGFLLTGEIAKMLEERAVTVAQITLDGPPEHHDARRHLLSKKPTFERIVKNLREAADAAPKVMWSIRVNIDSRNHVDISLLIDMLVDAGLGNRKNVKIYFAPVEAMTEGCHNVSDVTMTKAMYGQLEAELVRKAYDAGLTHLPYPPRYHGNCAAVRPGGFVVLPNGDIHKCWDTVSWPEKKVGDVFDLQALSTSEMAAKWLKWTPFDNDTCKNCKLLPNCAGACAYKFVHASDTRGEAAVLPCPSWKYNMRERLVHRALGKKMITEDDYVPEDIVTRPSELCADVHLEGGIALPAEMQSYYEAQKKQKRVHLTVLP